MGGVLLKLTEVVTRLRAGFAGLSPRALVGTGAGGAAAAMLVVALVLVGASGGGATPSDVVVATPPPVVTETATATPRPARTPRPMATVTATAEAMETEEVPPGVPSVGSVSALVSQYGYPADATFALLRIPSLGVDARVATRHVGQGQNMPNPAGPADVAWYDLSAWNGMGGRPGEGGNAIFSGHVDYNAMVGYAGVYYRGQAVFSRLGQLGNGDIIEIDYNGQTLRYAVVWTEYVPAVGGNWARIWSNNVAVGSVTLYTCGGEFNPVTKSYADRKVVRAERI